MKNIFKRTRKSAGLSANDLLKNISKHFSKGSMAEQQPPKVEQLQKTIKVYESSQLG